MTGKELTERAMKATRSRSAADLARALGLESGEAPRRVARWLRGQNEPDFHSTLLLLKAIGHRINNDKSTAVSPPLEDADALERLQHLEEQMQAVAQTQGEVLELIGRVVELLERAQVTLLDRPPIEPPDEPTAHAEP